MENSHQIHVAITDCNGKLLYSVGDPSRMTLVRSALKPLQAMAIVETGALERYNLGAQDLSLMCASHNGEEFHASRAKTILERAGLSETDLACGGHPSIDLELYANWIRRGFTPTPLWSNCSGKHSGMLAGTKAIGADLATYHQVQNPMQQRIAQLLQDMTGVSEVKGDLAWAIDGCHMATPAFPLIHLATINACLAAAADAQAGQTGQAEGEEPSSRQKTMARVFNAMSTYPEMVAGTDRFCTVLMKAFDGLLIGKVGAEGCYGLGVKAGAGREALGVSVKIEDGNMDLVYGVVAEILHRFSIGTPEMRAKLDKFHKREVKNTVGYTTGVVSFPFVLKKMD